MELVQVHGAMAHDIALGSCQQQPRPQERHFELNFWNAYWQVWASPYRPPGCFRAGLAASGGVGAGAVVAGLLLAFRGQVAIATYPRDLDPAPEDFFESLNESQSLASNLEEISS